MKLAVLVSTISPRHVCSLIAFSPREGLILRYRAIPQWTCGAFSQTKRLARTRSHARTVHNHSRHSLAMHVRRSATLGRLPNSGLGERMSGTRASSSGQLFAGSLRPLGERPPGDGDVGSSFVGSPFDRPAPAFVPHEPGPENVTEQWAGRRLACSRSQLRCPR